jgi:hypothetical protein
MTTYDSKHYDFATTIAPPNGPIKPPEGERWLFVDMVFAGSQVVVLWAKMKTSGR